MNSSMSTLCRLVQKRNSNRCSNALKALCAPCKRLLCLLSAGQKMRVDAPGPTLAALGAPASRLHASLLRLCGSGPPLRNSRKVWVGLKSFSNKLQGNKQSGQDNVFLGIRMGSTRIPGPSKHQSASFQRCQAPRRTQQAAKAMHLGDCPGSPVCHQPLHNALLAIAPILHYKEGQAHL